MILRYFRRRRAARELEAAKARVALISKQINENRRKRKKWVPLLGNLNEARHAMLRAETELGRW